MYNPAPFPENRPEVLHEFIREYPLAILVSCGPEGLEATHAPVVLHPEIGERGTLRCHIARANRQWKAICESPSVLVIFQGSEHYVTPSWYPSKKEHGKVVPTWNYVAVHIRGHARLFDEQSWLVAHVKELTAHNEAQFDEPWQVEDAPQDFVHAMTKAIVGIEISIESIEGKWKVSQNRPERDRQGVVDGLESLDSSGSRKMAEIVKSRMGRP